MNEIFKFKGHEVRTVTINNEPYFVGKDVANILGYAKVGRGINWNMTDWKETTIAYRRS